MANAANKQFQQKPRTVKKIGFVASLKNDQDYSHEALNEIFLDDQARRVYADGKQLVDLVPRKRVQELMREYLAERDDPDFNFQEFVNRHFYVFADKKEEYVSKKKVTAREHIQELWTVLERTKHKSEGSLIALPNTYIVPGGRFEEQFYWDSYFIMLGLAVDGRWDTIRDMIDNYVYMLQEYGMIPTANRTYFLSRSQPPFFAYMIRLLAQRDGRKKIFVKYLSSLLTEHEFWMSGNPTVHNNVKTPAYARVVNMPNDTLLNRYFDNKTTPRPESRWIDEDTAEDLKGEDKEKMFLDLRAGAESGWDFSSRWFRDPYDIESIRTTDLVPVDLNCLMYQLELTISEASALAGDKAQSAQYLKFARQRAEAINKYSWDPEQQFFCDYDFRLGCSASCITLAGVFPLFVKIATAEQAKRVAKRIEHEFLQPGGLVTTTTNNGQQWDCPNGWAPLQWVAIRGLREYGYHELANEIRDRWLATNERVFAKESKMVEKYNVMTSDAGGGGEYKLQDGFGWTNGVYAVLKDEMELNDEDKTME